MPTKHTRATSADVAKLAGLSRTTVSQILNGNDGRFPQETRDRVAAAAAELNYRPWRAGRALVSGVSDLVVIVVPNIWFGARLQDTIERFATQAEKLGFNAVVRYAGNDLASTITTILDLRPIAVYQLSAFDAETVAVLEASGTRVFPRASTSPDDTSAFDGMVGHIQADVLLRVPDRTLIYATLANARVGPFGPLRAVGFAEAAAAAGLPMPPVVDVPLDVHGAVTALKNHFTQPTKPIGVACYNDEVAIAVIAAARELGLSVPDQVAVIGMDRLDVGQLISPRLTTISVNMTVIDAYFTAELSNLLGPNRTPISPDVVGHPETVMTLIPGDSA